MTSARTTTRHTMMVIHGAVTRTIAAYARVRGDRPRKGRMTGRREQWRRRGKPSRSRSEIARENKEVAPRLSPLSLARSPSPGCFGCCNREGLPLARRISFLAQRRCEEIHRRDLVPFRNAERRVKINYAVFHRSDIYASTNFGCFHDENRDPHVLRVENITKITNEYTSANRYRTRTVYCPLFRPICARRETKDFYYDIKTY